MFFLPARIVTAEGRETVGEALRLLPPAVARLLGDVPVFEGDIEFAGYWRRDRWGDSRGWARCWWQAQPLSGAVLSSISLPCRLGDTYDQPVGVVLHELGHALYNRVARRHARTRVFWSEGAREVRVVPNRSGMVPAMLSFTGRGVSPGLDHYGEQFAEGFRIWLSPRRHLEAAGEPERFYSSTWRKDDSGYRFDNRRLLGWFNEVAGFPGDRPPVALR